MCFSAEASFAVSAALVPCGVYCVRAAMRKNQSYLALALVPLFFSFQQLCEGLVWLGYTEAGAAFLFFAIAFWPIWIPWSLFRITRRPETLFFVGMGLCWLTLYLLVAFQPVEVTVVNHSLHYDLGVADDPFMRLLYLVNVVAPLFFSQDRFLWVLGGVAIVTALITHIFLSYAFVSLWCFFAAVISLALCYLFWRMKNPGE